MEMPKTPSKFSWGAALLMVLFLSTNLFAQEAKVIELKGLNSMRYDKTTIYAKPGQKITIKLTAVTDFPATAMGHNFVLLKQTVDIKAFMQASVRYPDNGYIPANMQDQIIAHTPMATKGETVEVTFYAPKRASNYMFICTFPGHFLAGMKGTLIVQE